MKREIVLTGEEFAALELMRRYQKSYFRTRDKDAMLLAMDFERRVDALLERLAKQQEDPTFEWEGESPGPTEP